MKTVTMVALKLMTLNTGNSNLLGGLISIIKIENPDIVLLQELSVTSGQLKLFVAKYGYCAEANTDLLDITSLGTGMIWKSNVPVTEVTSVIECRGQFAKLGAYSILNIYAHSGSNNKQARRDFLARTFFV
jgi:exonuclease III